MEICVKFAETPEEMVGLFNTRHKVFVEEEGYMDPRPDGKIYDYFDAFPTTTNIIAVDDGQVIGGLRFTLPTGSDMPLNEFFDFYPYIPADGARIAHSSKYLLQQAYRRTRTAFYLMAMQHYLAFSRGVTHILGVVNPKIKNFVAKNGYKPVATEIYNEKKKLAFVPVILDMKKLSDFHLRFIKNQQGDVFCLPERRTALRTHQLTGILPITSQVESAERLSA